MYKPLKYILISIFTLTLFFAVVDGVAGTAIIMILLICFVIYKDKKMKTKAETKTKPKTKEHSATDK